MTQGPDTDNGFLRIASGGDDNDIVAALARTDLSGAERRCLDVVMRKTWGYQKTWDWISLTQYEAMTGLPRRTVTRSIKRLEKLCILGTRRSLGKTEYRMNKHFTEWGGRDARVPTPARDVQVPSARDVDDRQLGTPTSLTKDNLQKTDTSTEVSNVTHSVEDAGAGAPPPAEYSDKFFRQDKVVMASEVGYFMSQGMQLPFLRAEILAFTNYWLELTQGGKKHWWQTQKTFEVRRRLVTWLRFAAERKAKGGRKPAVIISSTTPR